MKSRLTITLIGALALSISSAALAHDNGYRYDGNDMRVLGGVGVTVDGYGNIQYAANLALGAPLVYAAVPYTRYAYAPRPGYKSRRAYARGYKHGSRKSHKHGHKGKHGKHHKH